MVAESDNSKAVLITGGTGFIASHLARKLVGLGNRVVLFELYPNQDSISDIADQVEVVSGDVANYQEISDILQKYNIGSVIHTAAMLSMLLESTTSVGSNWA